MDNGCIKNRKVDKSCLHICVNSFFGKMNDKITKLKIIRIILGACILYAFSAGLRSVYGNMVGAICQETKLSYSTVTMAIAIGQLTFGITQPLFGILALKKSKRFILMSGSTMMALGIILIPFCTSSWMLIIAMGIMLATGTGAVSFGMIIGTITPVLGEKNAVMASGLVNASSGIGGVVFSPLLQQGFENIGTKQTMICFAIIVLILVPISAMVSSEERKEIEEGKDTFTILKEAVKSPDYWCLLIGFFTCGYHMATIETHLFSQIVSYGIVATTAATLFSLYGFTTIVGSILSGFLCKKLPMKFVVMGLYGSRVILISCFLLMPKDVLVILTIMLLLGLTGAATLTPTSAITSKIYGAENLPILFGGIFFSHQLGSFFSAWIGGKCVETTGGYTVAWIISIVLSMIAAIASAFINENRQGRRL